MALHIWFEQNFTCIPTGWKLQGVNMYDGSSRPWPGWPCPFFRGLPQREQNCACGRKLVGRDVCILHSLRVTCGTAYEMVFDRFGFMHDVLLADKPNSVASGAVWGVVDEAELQDASCCSSGNFNIHSRTWRCKQTLIVLTCLPLPDFRLQFLWLHCNFALPYSTWQNPLGFDVEGSVKMAKQCSETFTI